MRALETMRAASRHIEDRLLTVTQVEALPVAVCRRGRAKIHDDIEDHSGEHRTSFASPLPRLTYNPPSTPRTERDRLC